MWIHRNTALPHGTLAQFRNAGPFGGIIHILIQRQTVPQTMNKPIVHDIIHFIRHILPPGLFSDNSCKRMFILLHHPLKLLAGQRLFSVFIQHKTGNGIFLHESLRAAHRLMAAVRARSGHIILQQDSSSFCGMNQRGIHIPHLIILCRFFGGCAKRLSGISRKTGLTRGHGNQIFHTVSPMNIHPLADRT